MRWEDRQGSDNIEDRRGRRMRGGGLPLGGGLGALILIVGLAALTGSNPLDFLGALAPFTSDAGDAMPPADDPQARFISVVLGDTEAAWTEVFQQGGGTYEPPTLVLFTGSTPSACGLGQSAMGPFYCPSDRKVYLDLSFFRDLDARFGAPGDFAQAYVVAHEVGHHIQTLLGVSARITDARQRAGERESNALSVRQELQADCYAGVWGAFAARNGLLETGDIEEGLTAAAAIGDDRLQQQSQGRVVPESFTHGSSADRVMWFKRGLDAGHMGACESFRLD